MEYMTPCEMPEQEVFQRVWQRVMAGRGGADSPAQMVAAVEEAGRRVDGDLSCDYLAALAAAPPMSPGQDRPGSDLIPAGMEAPLCGEQTSRLRQQTLEALEGWQFYRHLARRTRGDQARTLTNLAADVHRQARRLSAAYFLLTGLRYWPIEQLAAPVISSFWGALRQRHQAERQMELSYRTALDDVEDSTLMELYEDLILASSGRARQLRVLLEQSCP